MTVKFGTSGLRGLVTEMTPHVVRQHVLAFLETCDPGNGLCVGRDLRPSSLRITQDVINAARASGCAVIDCGALATPALALAAGQAGCCAVMVTGSHIPADRNGLKFYTRTGEITKADEAAILNRLENGISFDSEKCALLEADSAASDRYVARYVQAFGAAVLAGRRIGLYAHSSVGRTALAKILRGLGAEVVELGRSEDFIAVDTEAIDLQTRQQIGDWVLEHALHALVSADGDADRPLLADETGAIVPGDIMGQITAEYLGAETVVTPVSSNSGVLKKGFAQVVTTCIGSPYVIAGMKAAGGSVVGYEANGGFLLGFEAKGPSGPLTALLTRDCALPLVAVLVSAGQGGVAARVAREPPVLTRADRLHGVPTEKSAALIDRLEEDVAARAAFLTSLGLQEVSLDLTDGLRMTLKDGRVLHLRPSGNAPELRVYVEGMDAAAAETLLAAALDRLEKALA